MGSQRIVAKAMLSNVYDSDESAILSSRCKLLKEMIEFLCACWTKYMYIKSIGMIGTVKYTVAKICVL